jgi:hypothetical protein
MPSTEKIYWVFEDLDDATPVKIHKETCRFVQRRTNATTTQWYGPLNLQEAESAAAKLSKTNGWHRAKCCLE